MFKLALLQMRIVGGRKIDNVDHACDMIQQAASGGADIALLPEAMNLGWTHPSALSEADPIPDSQTFRRLQESAKANQILICAGLVEKAQNTVYNSAVLIDSDGALLLRHRKINELEIGHAYYQHGDRLQVCATKFGAIGLMICADAFATDRVLTRALCYMGADILLSPCSWAVVADHDQQRNPYGSLWREAYCSIAKEFSIWVAGASNVGEIDDGPWQGRR